VARTRRRTFVSIIVILVLEAREGNLDDACWRWGK
jgi:hypothetical protein